MLQTVSLRGSYIPSAGYDNDSGVIAYSRNPGFPSRHY